MARSVLRRIIGLMGRREQLSLLIPDCAIVHTFFMRSAIDIVFLDGANRITRIVEEARPWRAYAGPAGTRATLELPPGTIRERGIVTGQLLTLSPSASATAGD